MIYQTDKNILFRLLMVGWLVLWAGFAFAGDSVIDSLKQELRQATSDSMRARTLVRLGLATDDHKEAIDYYLRSIMLFEKLNDEHGKARQLNKIGWNYWSKGDFLSAIDYYEEALAIVEALGDSSWIARVSNNLGAVYWGLNDYNLALDLFQRAVKIRREENDLRGEAMILNNIGLIYQSWELYDTALRHHNTALQISENISDETDNLNVKAYTYNNLGRCYESAGDYAQALHYYQLSHENYYTLERVSPAVSLALKSIGDVYYKTEQYNKALSYYGQSLEAAKRTNSQFRIAIAEYSMGKTLSVLNRYSEAIEYIHQSLDKAKASGYNELIRDNHFLLSQVEEEQGNFRKALIHYQTASAMKDSIFNTEKVEKFTELQIKYSLEKKNRENELLRKNNEIQRLTIKRQQIIRNSAIAASIFALIILGLIVNRSNLLKKSNMALEEQNTNILNMNTEKENLILQLQKVIEERKQVEENLRESEQRLDLALKGAKVGMWDWKIHSGNITLNEQWAEIIGYTLDELSPVTVDTWMALVHPGDLKRSNRHLDDHFSGNTDHYECEVRLKHKNGHWVWALGRGKVSEWDESGKPLRMVGTHLDITDSKRIEEERLRIINKLEGKLEKKDLPAGFLSMCAGCHKIRDEDKNWHSPSEYLSDHTNLEFSHGMCPECMKRFYPDYYDKITPDED